jgi:integrase
MASIEKRVTSEGKTAYRVKVRLKGYPAQTATFDRRTDAKNWAQSTEAAIKEGRHFKTSEAKRRTLGEMIRRYLEKVLPAYKEQERKDRTRHLKYWKERLGDYSLADISPNHIADVRDELLAEVPFRKKTTRSPATVARYMASLSHAFTCAVNEWGWLEDSPMRKVKGPMLPKGRVRYLSDEERTALLKACKSSDNSYLYPVVVLALSTGMRQGEIMGLKWSNVDFQHGRIILKNTKNGESRGVPVTGLALEAMKNHAKVRKIDSTLVFPSKANPDKPQELRTAWLRALKEAKIDDFKFHDLRHTAASYLAMDGASLADIAEILGHKTFQMVKRYAHLSDDHTQAVVKRMNDKIFGSEHA